LNEVFSSFDLFSSKFSPGDKLIDIFSSCFYFHSVNRKSKEGIKAYICKLDNITFQASTDSKTVVVVSDTSIKNQVATSIAHIHTHNGPVIKMIYYAINVTLTKAELFVIRYSINQAIRLSNIN